MNWRHARQVLAQQPERILQAVGPRWAAYLPLPAAEVFHASLARYRWFFGGNRSGKSEATTGFDLCSYALGIHPARRTPRRATIWAVAPTWDMVGAIIWREKIRAYLPAHRIESIAWHNKGRDIPAVVTLLNGNQIEFKAFEQGRVAFQGRDIAAIYADEQCEHDSESIWQEMQMRLLDSGGFLAWSMTPLIAQGWLEARANDPGPDDAVFYADLNDNRISRGGYIADDRIEALIAEWPEEVQETRIRGHFAAFLGAVYKGFRRDVHVVPPFDVPGSWERYRGIDLGFNNPFVCLWAARGGPDRTWHVYREHYQARESLAWHAARIKIASGPERYIATWADHDAQDVYELAQKGLATLPAKKDVRLGIELVQAKLKVQGNGRPSLTISRDCPHLIREMIGYRWKEGTETRDPRDEPEKQNDHAPDALRYLLYSVEGDSYFQRKG
jgi:hypothetical protein